MTPPQNQIVVQNAPARAYELEYQIATLAKNMKGNFLDLCELLSEFRRDQHYLACGYASFDDWVMLADHGLDIKPRQANYCANVGEKAKELGITRAQLEVSKSSKLKTIFMLDTKEHGEEIKALVAQSASLSLKEVEAEVNRIRAKGDPDDEMTWRNFRVTRSAAENTIDPALEKVGLDMGSTIDGDGREVDTSNGRRLEMLAVNYLNNPPEEEE